MASLEFEKAMKLEHCDKTGSNDTFTTPNYKIETTPSREWGIVVNGDECSDQDMKHGRVIHSVDSMMSNKLAIAAKLTRV